MKCRAAILLFLAAMLLPLPLRAQFVLSDTDPAGLKWWSISTDDFRVIYPTGCDSLATVYIKELEKYKPAVGNSLGMVSGQYQRRPLPVLLHTLNSSSNGSVVWAPSRMELMTLPEWNAPSAMPWKTMLSIHEGRHAAQMQNGYRHVFKPFYYVLGEFIPSLGAAYPGHLLLEGDAVVAETALTQSGRGRNMSFLNRYYYSWHKGDTRSYMSWRIQSYYRPTPDHYSFGYALISGLRAKYDYPLLMADYFDYVSRRPYDLWPMRHTFRRLTGQKFMDTYREAMQYHYDTWAADTLARGPFMPARRISAKPKFHTLTSYWNPNSTPVGVSIWVKEDEYHVPTVVTIDDKTGEEIRRFQISNTIGKMNYEESDSSLLWNELRKDPRWGQKVKSIVLRYHIPTGKKNRVADYGEYLYPCEVGGDTVAAIHYFPGGGQHIDFLNKNNGRPLEHWPVPDSLQCVEITHIGTDIYAATISSAGYGIWKVHGTFWTNILKPQPIDVLALDHDGNSLVFESLWNGVREYFRYDLDEKQLYQVSSTLFGGNDFSFLDNGDLIFSSITDEGSAAYRTSARHLVNRPVKWEDFRHAAIADKLSEQEIKMGTKPASVDSLKISEPKRYRKAGHAIRFHSWAPFYANLDAISSLSYENIKEVAYLGAMGFFQNTASTFSGYIGYKAAPDNSGQWFHSGHLSLTYSGLYPVFELQMHLNDRKRIHYVQPSPYSSTRKIVTEDPYFNLSFLTYVPLSWSSGVHQYGVIPSAGLNFSNDLFNNTPCLVLNAGVRGYFTERTPAACIYPRWGVGAQIEWMDPFSYAYLYGYLPGVCCGQGWKLTALIQREVRQDAHFMAGCANLMPRGMADYSGAFYEGEKYTAEYAAPFYVGDWHISDAFFCSRGIFTPHIDCSRVEAVGNVRAGGWLFSAGATLELEFGAFLWAKTTFTIGFTGSYNWGSAYAGLHPQKNYYLGATASFDLF